MSKQSLLARITSAARTRAPLMARGVHQMPDRYQQAAVKAGVDPQIAQTSAHQWSWHTTNYIDTRCGSTSITPTQAFQEIEGLAPDEINQKQKHAISFAMKMQIQALRDARYAGKDGTGK